MDKYTAGSYNKNILELKKESEELKNSTLIGIERFETALEGMTDIIIAEDVSREDEGIELYTMEKLPPLSESIRQIF